MVDIAVQPQPLSAQQRTYVERAGAQVDPERLAELDLALTTIPSPTGQEREIAEFLVAHLWAAGLEGLYQPIVEQQGNAVGRLGRPGHGLDLLLYAPLDDTFAGCAEDDGPWIEPGARGRVRHAPAVHQSCRHLPILY
jgi:hypothetical protein